MNGTLPELRALIRVPSSDNGAEFLWAEQIEKETFRLLSVPVFAYGLSRGTVLQVAPANASDGMRLERVLRESSGATLRLYTQEPHLATKVYQEAILPRAAALNLGIGPATLFDPEVIAIHIHSRHEWQAVGRVLDVVVSSGVARFWELGDPDLQPSTEEAEISSAKAWQLVHPPPEDREVFLLKR